MKSFLEYIAEANHYSFIEDLANTMLSDLQRANKTNQYKLIKEYEFLEPVAFDIKLFARWEDSPRFEEDQHFKNLTWEKHNFIKHGYCINAIAKFNDGEYAIPEIDVFFIITESTAKIYDLIYSRLVGIIGHEVRHLKQIGLNKEPFMGRVSTKEERAKSQQNYKYFLLPEELDSMVEDKYIQSKHENRPVDEVIFDYLSPFVEDGFMNKEDFKKVYTAWIKRAIEFFPDANFSKNSEKIINEI